MEELQSIIDWFTAPPLTLKHGYYGYDCPVTGDHFPDDVNAPVVVLNNLKKKWAVEKQKQPRPTAPLRVTMSGKVL